MDIVRLRIPYSFIRVRTPVTWRDVRFGLTNDLIASRTAVDLAIERITDPVDPLLVELAAEQVNERILDIVERLAESEPYRSDSEIRDKWLYLVLAWLYEHRQDDPDPLQRVEEVYADFEYPERLAAFVRYMPTEGPDLGSREANERRLMERWKGYLDETAPRFAR